jgi:hypothetical protein
VAASVQLRSKVPDHVHRADQRVILLLGESIKRFVLGILPLASALIIIGGRAADGVL